MSELNTQLVLISGMSATGKSASLRNLRNQEKWFYANCEAGKSLPFKNKFKDLRSLIMLLRTQMNVKELSLTL